MDDVTQEEIARVMASLTKRRNQKLTAEQRTAIARIGGKASWTNVSKEERSRHMREIRFVGIQKFNERKAAKKDKE